MHERLTLGKMQNPVRGFLHGAAAVAALIGAIVLIVRASSWGGRIALGVFGLGLVALYTTSSLYHSIPWREVWKQRMQRLDHSMIFVLIAASFTPFAAVFLEGWIRVGALAIGWGIALVGIAQYVFFPKERYHGTIALMVTMGWLSLPLMIPIANQAGIGAVAFLAAGGVLYTIGMVILVTNWPKMWPRVFSYHELFHVLVVAASALHFTATWRYVVPAAG
ncbi:MAG: hemolysin III family protein [Acidimicrobiia bacterium]|nr:hemolysin III family protein [Acidimicrobiia bacterium]